MPFSLLVVVFVSATMSVLLHQVVLFRMGLLSCCADAVARNVLLDTKQVTHKTEVPCHGCRVRQEQLADGGYDVERNRRTDDNMENALRVVGGAKTPAEEQRLSKEHGVNDGEATNPLRQHVFANFALSVGVDIFHQDAQNSSKKVLRYLLGGLSEKYGKPLVAARAKDPLLRMPGTPPRRDFLGESSFASQMGQDIWGLMGVALVLLRPVLSSVASMVREAWANIRESREQQCNQTRVVFCETG